MRDKIKEARELAGLTQQELADKLQIKRQTVGKYENGERKPKLKRLQEIAKACNLSADFFLENKIKGGKVMGKNEFKDLQSLTGQESGLVIYDEGIIVCNWSHDDGLPFVSSNFGLIFNPGLTIKKITEDTTNDVSEFVDTNKIIYDINNDASDLKNLPGTLYTLENDVIIIAPKDWC